MKNEIVELFRSYDQYEDMSRMLEVATMHDLERLKKFEKEIGEVFDDHLNNGVINKEEHKDLMVDLVGLAINM